MAGTCMAYHQAVDLARPMVALDGSNLGLEAAGAEVEVRDRQAGPSTLRLDLGQAHVQPRCRSVAALYDQLGVGGRAEAVEEVVLRAGGEQRVKRGCGAGGDEAALGAMRPWARRLHVVCICRVVAADGMY